MSYANEKFQAIAFTGSSYTLCDTGLLLIKHEGRIYKMLPEGLADGIDENQFDRLADDNFATRLDQPVYVASAPIAFFIKSDILNQINVPPELNSSDLMLIRNSNPKLNIYIGKKEAIIELRKSLSQYLFKLINKKILNHYLQKDLINIEKTSEDIETSEIFCRYGMALSGFESLPGLYLDFALLFGLLQKLQGHYALFNRHYEIKIRFYSPKMTFEEYEKKINWQYDTLQKNLAIELQKRQYDTLQKNLVINNVLFDQMRLPDNYDYSLTGTCWIYSTVMDKLSYNMMKHNV